MRSREAKLDFANTYNLEEAEVEGYVEWISMLHDHVRVGFAIGDSLWEGIQYTPRPTPKPGNPSNGKRFKIQIVFHHTDTHIYILSSALDLSIHNKQLLSMYSTNNKQQFNIDRPGPIAFMPVAVDVSGRIYDDFLRLIFLHPHRESSGLANDISEESVTFVFFTLFYQILRGQWG
jgi:hypothetical protein